MTKKSVNDLAYKVFGAAIEVHKTLGPGLLESVYHQCLKYELDKLRVNYQTEFSVPINYKDFKVNSELRCDLFIENCVVVELKSVQELVPVFDAQLLTYMKLLKAPKGILINFNSYNLYEDGQTTFVNEYFSLLK